MNELDVYYRALLGYRKLTTEDPKCTSLRTAIATSSTEADKITVKTATCTIDEEWVNAIEKGLVHIEKAIKEERQFIRSNGEVLPIEKIKHVSKESIEHLAKHSDYITRYTEGEDIVPDKLYMVARLNDYAVYENRFLYMLLNYLCDFVTIRYNAILELTNKYDATVDFDKNISTGKEKLSYKVSMHDVRRDDPYLREHNPAKDIIDRIDLILKTIIAFLGTPLMEEAGKAPMLKPPITKTNVLKMNNNFKGAMALYSFIVAYDKPGYTTEIHEEVLAPFRDELADELAEAGGLISFLTYEWGLGIKPELRARYQREEERRAAEKIEQRKEKIAAMKRKLKNGGVTLEEYVITLEAQLKALDGESKRAEALADEVERLRDVEKRQATEIAELGVEIARLNQLIIDEKQRHFEEMEALKKAHEEAIHELIVKHEAEIAELHESYNKKISELNEAHENEIASLKERHALEIEEANRKAKETLDAAIARHSAAMAEANGECARLKTELEAAVSEGESLRDSLNISEARLKAHLGTDRDLTDRDSFNQLEREFNSFKKLYDEQWAKTKRAIRKKHINMKNIKEHAESEKSDSE